MEKVGFAGEGIQPGSYVKEEHSQGGNGHHKGQKEKPRVLQVRICSGGQGCQDLVSHGK